MSKSNLILFICIAVNIAACSGEKNIIKLGSRYYIFNKDYLKVNKAQEACQSYGTELASVTSQQEQDLLANYIKESGHKMYWLGGTDAKGEGEWYWIYSGQLFNYTNWHQGEPNNVNEEDFLAMSSTYGKWNDMSASASAFSICEVENLEKMRGKNLNLVKYNNEYFYFHNSATYYSWYRAQDYCETFGMKLAKIHSKEVNDFIYNEIQNITSNFEEQVDFWVGGSEDDDKWTWTAGEELSYTAWFTDRPKKYKINASHCLEVRSSRLPNENWFDQDCQYEQRFICSFLQQDVSADPVLKINSIKMRRTQGEELTFVYNTNLPIYFCKVKTPTLDIITLQPNTTNDQSIQYTGQGFMNGDCGIKIYDLSMEYNGSYSLRIGVKKVKENGEMKIETLERYLELTVEEKSEENIKIQDPTIPIKISTKLGNQFEYIFKMNHSIKSCILELPNGDTINLNPILNKTNDSLINYMGRGFEDGECGLHIQQINKLENGTYNWRIEVMESGANIFEQTLEIFVSDETPAVQDVEIQNAANENNSYQQDIYPHAEITVVQVLLGLLIIIVIIIASIFGIFYRRLSIRLYHNTIARNDMLLQ